MRLNISLIILVVILCLGTTSCGTEHTVQGKVVDSETGQPVEGAVVGIKWVHYKWGPPGLPTPKTRLGTTTVLTDSEGDFTIPRYLWRSYFMGVYKMDYICWSSETIFNPNGKDHDEIFKSRFWHRVKNGMVVRLKPMPDNITFGLRKTHACFTGSVCSRLNPAGLFNDAISKEDELCFKEQI
jgi:predicted small secreted protein